MIGMPNVDQLLAGEVRRQVRLALATKTTKASKATKTPPKRPKKKRRQVGRERPHVPPHPHGRK